MIAVKSQKKMKKNLGIPKNGYDKHQMFICKTTTKDGCHF